MSSSDQEYYFNKLKERLDGLITTINSPAFETFLKTESTSGYLFSKVGFKSDYESRKTKISEDLSTIISDIETKLTNGFTNSNSIDVMKCTGIQGIVDDFENKYKNNSSRNDVLTTLERIKPEYDRTKYTGGKKYKKKRRSTKRRSTKRRSTKRRYTKKR